MADPITAPIIADPDTFAQLGYDDLSANIPGWLPSNGNPTARVMQAFASLVAEWATLSGDVPGDIIKWIGTYMIGAPPLTATPASALSTWTMADTVGYTIPAGTQVGMTDANGNLVAFATTSDVTVPAGSGATSAGAVRLEAVTPGSAANDLTGPVTLIDNLSFVADNGIVLSGGTTSGGTDDETTSAYQTRYGPLAQLVAPRPITASDYELFARVYGVGVARALALDGYDAVAATSGNARTVTVAVQDASGLALGSTAKSDLLALYEAKREANFVVYVIDGTYTTIDVTFAGRTITGYDPTEVQTRAIAAIQQFLNPGGWGLPPTGEPLWLDRPTVRYQDLVTALNNVDGFDYYTSLLIGIHGASLGTSDITLTGPAALPLAGTISGAVT